MEDLKTVLSNVAKFFSDFNFIYALQIVVFTVALAVLLKEVNRNFGKRFCISGAFYYVLIGLLVLFDLKIPNYIFLIVVLFFVTVMTSLFSKEYRKSLTKGQKLARHLVTETEMQKISTSIITALKDMSERKVGALIVLKRENDESLFEYLEEGQLLNADISVRMIESVFYPGAPMHDGAMVIEGKQVRSASGFVQILSQTNVDEKYGTRHRAAIAIAKDAKVTAIVVSEERGTISYVEPGTSVIKEVQSDGELMRVLKNYYWVEHFEEVMDEGLIKDERSFKIRCKELFVSIADYCVKNYLYIIPSVFLAVFTALIINI